MTETIRFKIGDWYSGILLTTHKDAKISRPRVKPMEYFGEEMRVEFPRSLREQNPLGTQFRATVKVAQKHNKDGTLRGNPYLIADTGSIQIDEDYSPLHQIYAIPVGDRLYEYVAKENGVSAGSFLKLREKAILASTDSVEISRTTTVTRKRNIIIRSYALERSKGVCEACDAPAPFTSKNGKPYLEVHHIIALSEGGSDHPINVAAICPNCHRRTEKSDDSHAFNNELMDRIKNLETNLS